MTMVRILTLRNICWSYISETNAKPIILYDYKNIRPSSSPKAFI